MKLLTGADIVALANENDIPYACLKAIIEVEGSGRGYDTKTGKVLIQFEPSWFKRECAEWKAHQSLWIANKVGVQSAEWDAFNDAFKIDANAAMESTSIGMMQVMGFHYKDLGFDTVGDMWDYAKESERNQVDLGIRFIKSNSKLYKALQNADFATVAFYYNGAHYKSFNYDTRLLTAYQSCKMAA